MHQEKVIPSLQGPRTRQALMGPWQDVLTVLPSIRYSGSFAIARWTHPLRVKNLHQPGVACKDVIMIQSHRPMDFTEWKHRLPTYRIASPPHYSTLALMTSVNWRIRGTESGNTA